MFCEGDRKERVMYAPAVEENPRLHEDVAVHKPVAQVEDHLADGHSTPTARETQQDGKTRENVTGPCTPHATWYTQNGENPRRQVGSCFTGADMLVEGISFREIFQTCSLACASPQHLEFSSPQHYRATSR